MMMMMMMMMLMMMMMMMMMMTSEMVSWLQNMKPSPLGIKIVPTSSPFSISVPSKTTLAELVSTRRCGDDVHAKVARRTLTPLALAVSIKLRVPSTLTA
jgi:hypothetical protein